MEIPDFRRVETSSDQLAWTRIGRLQSTARMWTLIISLCGIGYVLLRGIHFVTTAAVFRYRFDSTYGGTYYIAGAITLACLALLIGIPASFLLVYSNRLSKLKSDSNVQSLPLAIVALRRFWIAATICTSILALFITLAMIWVSAVAMKVHSVFESM